MRSFSAIYLRELRAYFYSPIAYVLLAGFLLITGFFFYSGAVQYAQLSLQAMQNPMLANMNLEDMLIAPLLGNQSVIMMFLAPMLTMRLLSEEKRSGTIELLLSYPLSDAKVVLAKFLAAWSISIMITGFSLIHYLVLASAGPVHWPTVFSGYLGIVLAAGAFTAIGLAASALTENQIVAAFLGFGSVLLLWLIGFMAPSADPRLAGTLKSLGLAGHFQNFPAGLIDTADLAYFALFMAFFLFLTIRILEAKRWKG